MSIALLVLSVLSAGVRGIFSKNVSDAEFGEKKFFSRQTVMFLSGSAVMWFILLVRSDFGLSTTTLIYSLLYGLMLLITQYGYIYALKKGNLGMCTVVYSVGFIFPMMSGSIFWNETLNAFNVIGILVAISVIVILVIKAIKDNPKEIFGTYLLPLIFAMLASGGLGILQKVLRKSPYPDQSGMFIAIAFTFAGVVSFIISCLTPHKENEKISDIKTLTSSIVGVTFVLTNFLNTLLAGMLPSAVFFPTYNISNMIFSMLVGVIIFREKLKIEDYLALGLGVTAVVLLAIS